jgi:hypothetical protein
VGCSAAAHPSLKQRKGNINPGNRLLGGHPAILPEPRSACMHLDDSSSEVLNFSLEVLHCTEFSCNNAALM